MLAAARPADSFASWYSVTSGKWIHTDHLKTWFIIYSVSFFPLLLPSSSLLPPPPLLYLFVPLVGTSSRRYSFCKKLVITAVRVDHLNKIGYQTNVCAVVQIPCSVNTLLTADLWLSGKTFLPGSSSSFLHVDLMWFPLLFPHLLLHQRDLTPAFTSCHQFSWRFLSLQIKLLTYLNSVCVCNCHLHQSLE